ncbi:MAG: hemerythrin family protein [Desulfatiglans sp.]|nr:hemerythrin family protein [Desulfatiglans sp.]
MNNNLYIIWDDRSKLGIPIIDEQHRSLISTINSLYFYIQNRVDWISIKSIMIILQQYTNIHFKTEEGLLEKAGYPDLTNHINLHQKIVVETKRISQNIAADPEEILSFLKNWWVHHINYEDKKYVSHMKMALSGLK